MSVLISVRASKQIENALSYLQLQNKSAAAGVASRITEVVDLLEHQPRAGRPTSRRSTRRFSLWPYPYVRFYKVVGDDVIITRFIHAARRTAWTLTETHSPPPRRAQTAHWP